MFGLSWTRTMEPTPGSLIVAADGVDETDDPFALTPEETCHPQSAAKIAVWESVLSWMQGNAPVTSASVVAAQAMTADDVEKLGKLVETSESETERVGT